MTDDPYSYESVSFDLDSSAAIVTALLPTQQHDAYSLEARERAMKASLLYRSAIQFAHIALQIEGYVVRDNDKKVVDVVTDELPFAANGPVIDCIRRGSSITLAHPVEVPARFGAALIAIAESRQSHISDILSYGIGIHQRLLAHSRADRAVTATKSGNVLQLVPSY